MRRAYTLRIRLLFGVMVCTALVLTARLYSLQVIHGEEYVARADNQYVQSNHRVYDRGTIYFTDKEERHVSAASVESGYVVALHPDQISNPEIVFDALSAIIPVDRDIVLARAGKKGDPYEEIARRVKAADGEAIAALNLSGVSVHRERWRSYPGKTLGAHVVGLVGYRGESNEIVGQYGLERSYDETLLRTEKQLSVNFFAEMFSDIGEALFASEKARSGSLITTIDPFVQQELESILRAVEGEWGAKTLGGIIMDPATGEVRAMATLPTFDPGDTRSVEDPAVFNNALLSDVREMGSIIKPISMAIGLDEGVVTPQTTFHDPGSIVVDGLPIRNYDGRGRGDVSMQEVLGQSLNTGMAFVVRKVGTNTFGERLRAFGFGEKTGIDLPGEASGLVSNLESPRSVEYVTASFGQGIALTPIATTRALAALGNGGKLVTPHVVRSIAYESGKSEAVSHPEAVQVISPETSETITRMLVAVVDKSLRNGTVKKDRYAIAAKTGTAQIARENERGYHDDRYLHSFFGYFPAYQPRFIIFLYHVDPQGAQYASETLTTPFMNLVDFLINYYQVPPDR